MTSVFRKKLTFGEVDLEKTKKKNSGAFREAMAKFSRAVMLPIAMLPIGGLALGIGTTINSQSTSEIGQAIGSIIMMPGQIMFAVLPLLFGIAIAITFTNDSGTAALSTFLGYCIFSIFQSALIINPAGTDPNYHFLFYDFTPEKFSAIFTNVIGIETLSSSIFGGVIVGVIVAFLYNRYKTIQLPKALGFFSGVRFIPIVTFATMCVVGMFFAMV
ncbi:hypothetical protein AGMMS50256_32190 [Betaproteobacteria bacterium]|nr:hypothetical protein AGMMS50256_32120 [Betaproteobacteria bacterium]GHU36080.1 hypothetical protein AGMMS50256_32190 [Betaproteobacteria bacterium]